jgi:hypothetical protein
LCLQTRQAGIQRIENTMTYFQLVLQRDDTTRPAAVAGRRRSKPRAMIFDQQMQYLT